MSTSFWLLPWLMTALALRLPLPSPEHRGQRLLAGILAGFLLRLSPWGPFVEGLLTGLVPSLSLPLLLWGLVAPSLSERWACRIRRVLTHPPLLLAGLLLLLEGMVVTPPCLTVAGFHIWPGLPILALLLLPLPLFPTEPHGAGFKASLTALLLISPLLSLPPGGTGLIWNLWTDPPSLFLGLGLLLTRRGARKAPERETVQ